jgi:hypothetical protein
MAADEHPVWTAYDRLRSVRLSVKYYGRRLQYVERFNFWLELCVLVATPTSVVAGLWFWKLEVGQTVWQWLGAIAAVAAVVKQLLGLTKRIKEYESVLAGYRVLEYDLRELKDNIERKRKFDPALQSELRRIIQREKALAGKSPEPIEHKKTKRICEEEVNEEFPVDRFFIPEE